MKSGSYGAMVGLVLFCSCLVFCSPISSEDKMAPGGLLGNIFGFDNKEISKIIDNGIQSFQRDVAEPLRKIEKNTARPDDQNGKGPADLNPFIFRDALVDKKITLTARYFVFLGMSTSGLNIQLPIDPVEFDFPTKIRFEVEGLNAFFFGMRPGDYIPVPKIAGTLETTAYLTGGTAGFWLWFIQTDYPEMFAGVMNLPFHEAGTPRRARLKTATRNLIVTTDPSDLPTVRIEGSAGDNKVRLVDASGDEADIGTGGGDGAVTSTNGVQVYNRNSVFNGSTWDRQRGDTVGTWTKLAGGKTVLRAAVNFSTSGDNQILAAAGASIKNKVLGIFLYAAGDVTLKLTNGNGGTVLLGPVTIPTTGFILPLTSADLHWLETTGNVALVGNLSANIQVGGLIVYLTET